MNKEIAGFLAKTLNRESDAVASLFNEDGSLKDNAISTLNEWDADRVTKLKTAAVGQGTFDQGYKKGQAKASENFEKRLKEQFELETESTGDELIAELREKSKSTPANTTLTDDHVKKHPAYIKAEKDWQKKVKEATETGDKALKEYQDGELRKERSRTVIGEAETIVKEKGAILPEDAGKAKLRLKRDVFDPLTNGEYDYDTTDPNPDNWLVLDKEGKRVDDDHGHPVKFKDHVLKISSAGLDFKQHEERQSPHGTPKQNTQSTKPKFVPKDDADYQNYLKNKDVDPLEKREVMKDWASKQRA